MDQAQEIMHMNKLLEVEDLSFKLQLEDAVSFSHLSRSDVFCYLLKILAHGPFDYIYLLFSSRASQTPA